MTKAQIKLVAPYMGIPIICLFLFFFQRNNVTSLHLLHYVLAVIFGYVAAVGDIKTKKIPNSLILIMLATWIVSMFPLLFVDMHEAIVMLRESGLGFLVAGGLFLLVYIVNRKGLGGGDVKFIAATGLFLGFNGVMPAMLVGTILASIVGLTLLALKKLGLKDSMPMAPFLFAGILVFVFLG